MLRIELSVDIKKWGIRILKFADTWTFQLGLTPAKHLLSASRNGVDFRIDII